MIRTVFTTATVLLAFALGASNVSAQAPLTFTNSAEAVRQYEQGTLETLRERCTHLRSDTLRERPDIADMANGFIAVLDDKPQGPRYSLLAYDKDKRSFTLIDGQRLGRDIRLLVPLALPRDYANCRIVRNGQAQEFLEVVQIARNEPSGSDTLTRLHGTILDAAKPEARVVPALEGHPLCTNPSPKAGAGAVRANIQVLGNGEAYVLDTCSDAMLYLSERVQQQLRKVLRR
jgi:hypothetical protein